VLTTLRRWFRAVRAALAEATGKEAPTPAALDATTELLTTNTEDSMEPFLALITPIVASGGGNPPGIWGPGGPWPTPPINLPPGWGSGNPPGIWGPPGPWVTPPIHLGPGGGIGGPPGTWGGAGQPFPTPPINLPPGWGSGNPPGIWGPPGPWVTPPIYLPGKPGEPPHLIWGPNDPRPTPPIYLPPTLPEGGPGSPGNPLPVPPLDLPAQPIAGVVPFYIYLPGQNALVGPIYAKPGETPTPGKR
jgi:hypothetical protein